MMKIWVRSNKLIENLKKFSSEFYLNFETLKTVLFYPLWIVLI